MTTHLKCEKGPKQTLFCALVRGHKPKGFRTTCLTFNNELDFMLLFFNVKYINVVNKKNPEMF